MLFEVLGPCVEESKHRASQRVPPGSSVFALRRAAAVPLSRHARRESETEARVQRVVWDDVSRCLSSAWSTVLRDAGPSRPRLFACGALLAPACQGHEHGFAVTGHRENASCGFGAVHHPGHYSWSPQQNHRSQRAVWKLAAAPDGSHVDASGIPVCPSSQRVARHAALLRVKAFAANRRMQLVSSAIGFHSVCADKLVGRLVCGDARASSLGLVSAFGVQ